MYKMLQNTPHGDRQRHEGKHAADEPGLVMGLNVIVLELNNLKKKKK